MREIIMAALLVAGSAQAQTVLYSTFSDDQQNLFDCCNSWRIAGAVAEGGKASVAIPFTPLEDARIIEVDVALSQGVGGVAVELRGSTSGLPGRLKRKFEAREIPPGGQCCVFNAMQLKADAPGVLVQGGGTYWVEVHAQHLSEAGWNYNSLGLSGDVATLLNVHGGHDFWIPGSGVLPAVRIIAK